MIELNYVRAGPNGWVCQRNRMQYMKHDSDERVVLGKASGKYKTLINTLPKKYFRCEIPSWMRVIRDSERLSSLVKRSKYNPDIIVAIGRGGFIPSRILCDYLLLKDMATIKVEHWGVAKPKKKAVIRFPLCADIKAKRVLLVDDITDTGETLRVSFEYLKGFGPKEIRTAVLVHKATSRFQPDYYVRKIIKWRWVIFPWHIREDITSFIEGLKNEGIRSWQDIRSELKSRYCMSIRSKLIKEILSELEADAFHHDA